MVSQFFYLPANQKVDEEKRIAYTQGKIKTVKDMLSEHFLCPGNRCKIELIDYQYLLMQLFRDNGRKVSWLNHTIEISLNRG